MTSSRRLFGWGVAAVSTVLAVAGVSVVAGAGLKSPRQAAADAAPPPAVPVTVAAEQRVLSEPVTLRGQVVAGQTIKVMPPANASGPDSVITSVSVEVGQQLPEGKVVAVRSGEPMIAMALPFPLYRDIVGGASGPDVVEIQKALTRLGYRVQANGQFNSASQSAVRRLFKDRGFEAPPGSAAAAQRLAGERSAVQAAELKHAEAVASGVDVELVPARLAEAKRALVATESEAGPSLQRANILRIDRAGRKITSLALSVGVVLASADIVILELDGQPPFVTAEIARDRSGLVAPGHLATITDEQAAKRVEAVVESVHPPGDTDTSASGGYTIWLRFANDALPLTDSGSVRVDMTTAGTSAAVLAVPVSGVYSRPDGSVFVVTQRNDGKLAEVNVEVGQIAGGWVEVVADPKDLRVGTQVVVGERRGGIAE